jgi:hypothetical protein
LTDRVRAARTVLPASIQLSIGPFREIWLRWSMTQIESKPDDSAAMAISASLSSRPADSTSGRLKSGIRSPMRVGAGGMRR